MSRPYEQEQRDLNPNRLDEERQARLEAEYRLSERGIEVAAADTDEEVADLLEAIERFETAVEARGGDLFVDRIGSSEPEHPAFVPPERDPSESAGDYRRRIEAAAGHLRRP
jgi:predicted house-cleaning noncanonical NTP pyrophosphatase (MazG superfamily)